METIQLQLNKPTLERAKGLSALRRCSFEELIKKMIEQPIIAEPANNNLVGMFKDEPELMDQIIESAMSAREKHFSKIKLLEQLLVRQIVVRYTSRLEFVRDRFFQSSQLKKLSPI